MSDAKETPNKINWNEQYGKKDGKKSGKKGLIIGIAVAVVVVIAGIVIFNKVRQGIQTAKDALGDGTIVDEFGEKDMSTYVDVTGTVESQEVTNVTTTLTYPVEEIKVEVGDHVKKGDVLCIINTDDIDEKIEALEAQASDDDRMKAKELEAAAHTVNAAAGSKNRSIKEAGLSIDSAKAEYEESVAEYNATVEAYNSAVEQFAAIQNATNTDAIPEDAITAKDIKEMSTAVTVAEATMNAKQAAYNQVSGAYNDTVAAASEGYQTAKDQSDLTVISNTQSYSQIAVELANCYKMKNDAVIIAESNGIVTSIGAAEGLPVSGTIMVIENDEKLKLDVSIKEKDIFSVREGMEVEFSNSSLTNVSGKGKVSKVNQFATTDTSSLQAAASGQGSVSADNAFKATLEVTEFTDMLLGMKLKARIATGDELTTEAVPYTAIMTDVDGDYVYVAEPAGNGMYMVARKDIEKGMSGDYYTQVTGGDLEEGDLVIAYPSTVTENSVITIKDNSEEDGGKETTEATDKDDSKDSKDKDEE